MHEASSVYRSGGLRDYGRQVVENAARMATGRMPVCFVAGTRVLVGYDAEGNAVSRAIEDVAEGDLVLSRADGDEADGLDARAVARVFRRTSDHLQIVTYRDAAGGTETVRTTGEHPFWVEGAGWVAAGDLRAGDVLGDADGLGGARLAVLSSVREEHPEGVAVYNFEVEGDHTYLVEDGADGGPQLWAWVHNTCVYQEVVNGKPRYFGITDQTFEARAGQQLRKHGRVIRPIAGLENIPYRQARVVEHLLIEKYGRIGKESGGILTNINNGIQKPKLKFYKSELQAAQRIIDDLSL